MTDTLSSYHIHGVAGPGEHLTLPMDFYQLTTSVNIIPDGVIGSTTQAPFDALMQIISLNGQPVLSSVPYSDGNGHYIFKFAIDHTGSWVNGGALVAAIVANTPASMGFAADSALAVTIMTATQNS